MRLSKVFLAVAATSMATVPVAVSAATANPAAKLSVSKGKAGSIRASSKAGKSKAGEEGIIVLALAGTAVVVGVIAATSGDSSPSSP